LAKTLADEYKSAWKKYSERKIHSSPTEKRSIELETAKCSRVLKRYSDSLFKYPNVVGMGVSMKYKNGEVLDRPCIVVYVTKKVPNLKQGALPTELDGCLIDILETGLTRFAASTFVGPVCPLQPGYSIAHYKVGSGTLGCLVREKPGTGVSNSPYSDILLLSCNHVLANWNRPLDGRIFHPSRLHHQPPLRPSLKSASLVRWKDLVKLPHTNNIDAAVAKPLVPVSSIIKMIGTPIGLRSIDQSVMRIQVQKTGAKSGHTTGTVTAINSISDVEDDYKFQPCISTTKMSEPGDSGALLLDMNRRALGMLFAGNSTVDFFNHLEIVLNDPQINVDLVDTQNWP
jgi:hypothetical protein